jgi:excinuclease ABC subunit B
MFRSDRSRKQTLVDYGFRLPSALDNRPLTYEEFASRVGQCIYVSATPTKFEIDLAQGVIVEQIIRPTGLMDPKVFIRSANTQVDDLIGEIRTTVASGSRVMVTTLTKRMSEDLTDFLTEHGIRVQYLHSDIKTLERLEIVRSLRAGKFDVLVGINLLREGLDIPEVALVAILDADREGFLRSECALIQTMGRASRNDRGRVILYAEKITQAITHAREETLRRRNLQQDYNHAHNITPRTIQKSVIQMKRLRRETNKQLTYCMEDAPQYIHKLERQMKHAASQLDFERAAQLRDQIAELKRFRLFAG